MSDSVGGVGQYLTDTGFDADFGRKRYSHLVVCDSSRNAHVTNDIR